MPHTDDVFSTMAALPESPADYKLYREYFGEVFCADQKSLKNIDQICGIGRTAFYNTLADNKLNRLNTLKEYTSHVSRQW